MPLMFCYFDPFVMQQTVFAVEPNENTPLFEGTMDEVCSLIASYYATGNYERIILTGALAKSAADHIRVYGKINYNLDDINIEVI